jgi:hypothetical protein
MIAYLLLTDGETPADLLNRSAGWGAVVHLAVSTIYEMVFGVLL